MSFDESSSEPSAQGKGRPTPTRKEAEAARKKVLTIPKDTKAARKAARERERSARAEGRAKMLDGDPKYLLPRDSGPARLAARNYIDSRHNLGELFVPAAFVVLILSMNQNAVVKGYVTIGWFLTLVAFLLDMIFISLQVNTYIASVVPEGTSLKGCRIYAVMRSLQLRRFRIPKAVIKKGERPAPKS